MLFVLLLCLFSSVQGEAEDTGDYIHYRLGVKYKNEKKYDEAIDEFRKVLAVYPDNYNAYMHMAEIRSEQNRPRLVIYNLRKALSYNPGWGKAHKLLAASYEKDGQIQKAILEIQQYQQSSDPAERDSLQRQIDRLIQRVTAGRDISGTDSSAGIINTQRGTAPDTGRVDSSKQTITSGKTERVATSPVVKKKANNPKAEELFRTAVSLYEKHQYDSSLEQIRQVLALQPDHAGAFYYGGLIRRRNGQNKMAKINFSRAVDYPELGHNAHFYLGKIFAEEKNYAQAIRQLEMYIEKTSYEQGKKEARDLIEQYKKRPGVQIAAVEPPVPQEHYTQLEIRIDSLLSMMTVDTLTDIGQQLLAGIHEFTAGNYDNAIREFKKVLAENPRGAVSVHCLYNTGVCYFKLGLFKEAENQFQQILDRYPQNPIAAQSLFLKALSYLERKESSTAETLLRKFIQSNRNHEWTGKAYEKLGDAYVDLEQPKKAIEAYTQAAASGKHADKVCALYKLGTMYFQIGNSRRGYESLQSAIDLGEKQKVYIRVPDSYYRIADEKYKVKAFSEALSYYTRVIRKYPSYQETPWGMFQIGGIHKNEGRYQEAITIFKDLIRKYPDDYWAKQAQWKMEDAIWEHEYRAVLR